MLVPSRLLLGSNGNDVVCGAVVNFDFPRRKRWDMGYLIKSLVGEMTMMIM